MWDINTGIFMTLMLFCSVITLVEEFFDLFKTPSFGFRDEEAYPGSAERRDPVEKIRTTRRGT